MGDIYVAKVKSLDKAVKEKNTQLKKLREQRETANLHLYNWMVRNQVQEYEGIKISRITPKKKRPRKKLAEKKQETIGVLADLGVENPEYAWEKIHNLSKRSAADAAKSPEGGVEFF